MIANQRSKILRNIHSVFSTNPRISSSSATIWLGRRSLENKLNDALHGGTKHICVDGPSGSGKTSLVRSVLTENDVNYVYVQVTNSMDWPSLCNETIGPKPKKSGFRLTEVKLGLNGLKPSLQVSGKKDVVGAPIADRDFTAKWAIQDLAYLISEEGVTLVIDDVEKANTDLLQRIADLLKICTSTYETQVIFIGTGDVCFRVYSCDRSLSSRIEQINVGSIEDHRQSWELLSNGFDKLGFKHPQKLAQNVRRSNVNADLKEAARAVYLAADGLPKLMNELGTKICESALGKHNLSSPRMNISRSDIVKCCDNMVKSHISLISRRFPNIIKVATENAQANMLLRELYSRGVNKIHYWQELENALIGRLEGEDFQFAMQSLIEAHLFIKTGMDSEVVFAEDPVLAHIFGVVSANPKKYRLEERFSALSQFQLPLLFDDDS